jgi:hypothetical protein
MQEQRTLTREGNAGAQRADAGSEIRAAGERPSPKALRAQELGLAIARILQDRDLRLKLEACTMPLDGKTISAVEMLGGKADKSPDGRSLIGAVTRVLSDKMLLISLMPYSSGANGTSKSAADILQEYALNPNNWELTGWKDQSRFVRGIPETACLGMILG